MNGYDLSRQWFDFAFETPECKAQHCALYCWMIELNNRLGWKKQFGLPTVNTMEGLSMTNRNVYLSTLKDIEKWGFITIVKLAKNQNSSCLIELSHIKSDTASDTALDKALIRHGYDTIHDIDTIDKPRNQETKKPRNVKARESFDPLSAQLPFETLAFREAWIQWCEHRLAKGKPITPQSHKAQIKKLADCKNEKEAIKMIEKAIERNWESVFPLNDMDKKDLAAKEASVIPLNDLSDEITLERERRRGMYEVICRSSPHSKGQPMEFPEAISKFHKLIGLYDELRSA